jgi:uncharacterized Zn-binding protein involved in type VI secretion
MGKPAARLGDTTAHGGSIIAGAPTVLIGGMPAARMNDMHVCPMLNPGTPPPPHIGQQIILGCPTVMICGQMAARMGDMVMCSGPPDSIVAGCPTVLIGEGGGGGAGAGPGGAAASAAMAGGGTSGQSEGHYLDVKFVDKAGKPIKGVKFLITTPDGDKSEGILSGQIKKTGIKQGSYEIAIKAIASAQWSVADAKVGDKVKLLVETSGIDSGTPATLQIFVRDGGDKLLKVIETKVDNDKIEEEWVFKVDEEYLKLQDAKERAGGYSSQAFYFTVKAGDVAGRSGMLQIKDWVEFTLKDKDGNPLANKEYRAILSTGEVRKGKLDGNGHDRLDKVPPGKIKIVYDIRK